jgi:predicted dehydrogenase
MKAVIIGAGRMGLRHIQVARAAGLEVCGVCDARPEALQQAAAAGIDASRQFGDARAMLDKCDAEVVIVATTAPSHEPLTCVAAEKGAKYILCEKPMATSIAGCSRMIDACRRAGARLAVNHQMRFMEQYTKPKALLQSEDFGGLASVAVIAGNFGLAMNGSHYLEMFRYMTGEAPSRINAWFSTAVVPNPRGPQFEDRAGSIRAVTPSGKRFYMEAGDDQGHGVRVVFAARHGQIAVDELIGEVTLSYREAAHRSLPTTRYGMPWIDSRFSIAPADAVMPSVAVLKALIEGNDYPSGEDARNAVSALVAAYVSAEHGGQSVSVSDAGSNMDRTFPWA